MFSHAGFILKTCHQQNFIEFLLACLLIKQYSSVYLTTNLITNSTHSKKQWKPITHLQVLVHFSEAYIFKLFTLVNFSVAVFPWEIPNLYPLNAVGSPVSHVAYIALTCILSSMRCSFFACCTPNFPPLLFLEIFVFLVF